MVYFNIMGRGVLYFMRYIDYEESAITLTAEIRVSNTVDGIISLR